MTASTASTSRGRLDPMVLATLVFALVTTFGLYQQSEQLLVADNRLGFYSLLAAPGVGVVALIALIRRDAVGRTSVRWYGGTLAVVGMVVMLFQAVHAWGLLTGAAPWCAGNTRCSDGIGSPFLHLSWLDWTAIATYFAGIGAAASS